MPSFQVVSDYTPSGDQPEAIEALAQGVELRGVPGVFPQQRRGVFRQLL